MNREKFLEELNKLGIELTGYQMIHLNAYCEFLKEYNKHTNLTSITEDEQIFLKHFYDSLTIVKAINLNEYDNLLDVGTGAGFPGMVLKIVFPHLHVTLLDSNNKKINFLKELVMKLELRGVEFYHGRVEDFCQKNREKFDVVTGRAVTNMTALSELCLPLTKIDGYFIAMKGSNEEEIKDAEYAIKMLGGNIEEQIKFNLPIEESGRNIIKIKKIKNTPKEYPRRYDKIVKYPLKNNGK